MNYSSLGLDESIKWWSWQRRVIEFAREEMCRPFKLGYTKHSIEWYEMRIVANGVFERDALVQVWKPRETRSSMLVVVCKRGKSLSIRCDGVARDYR
jgi:hypothetical protein